MKKSNIFLDVWHLLMGGQQVGQQDRLALQIAAKYGMTTEYKEARRHNLRPYRLWRIGT